MAPYYLASQGDNGMQIVTEADIFSRIFEPEKPDLSPEAARSLLQLDFKPKDRERINTLAKKARKGKLTKQEDDELEKYIQVGHVLGMIQSKARQSLKKAGVG